MHANSDHAIKSKQSPSDRHQKPLPSSASLLDQPRALVARHPHLLLLAGSWQRGEATESSDVDLLCIVRDVASMSDILRKAGYSPKLCRFQVVRIELCDRPPIAVRVMTEAVLRNLFSPDASILSWRESSIRSVTELSEFRVRADGKISLHPWNEKRTANGFVRELPRFDSSTGLPLATTEVSMLISGVEVSSFGIKDEIRRPVWQTFSLGRTRVEVGNHHAYSKLADPRRTLDDQLA